jgi:hypothetical protein
MVLQTAASDNLASVDAASDIPAAGAPWRSYNATQPEAGQIWKMTWDDVSALGVVGRAPDGLRTMVRLLVEDEDLDALGDSVSADLAGGTVDVSVMKAAVWMQLATFEACVGALKQEIEPPEDLLELDGLAEWMEGQLAPWADDLVVDLIDEMALALETLGHADWAAVRPPNVKIELDAAQLLDAGIAGPRAIALARGAMPLEAERRPLRALGIDPTLLEAVPAEIRAELDRPQYKVSVLDRARRRQISELEVRQALATELRMPVAARTTSGAPVSIASLLKDLLDD